MHCKVNSEHHYGKTLSSQILIIKNTILRIHKACTCKIYAESMLKYLREYEFGVIKRNTFLKLYNMSK